MIGTAATILLVIGLMFLVPAGIFFLIRKL